MESPPKPGPELRLFEHWMETTKWLMARTERFPKRLRHSLTTRVENLALGILEEVTTAAYRKNRKGLLERTDEKLGRLKVVMRLCHELRLLSHGQYEEIAERLAEAGRMLGGWLKTERSAAREGGRAC